MKTEPIGLTGRAISESGQAVEEALNILPTPAWVVREDAHVEFANTAARTLMRTSAWVRELKGRLTKIGSFDAAAIRRHVQQGTAVVGAHRGRLLTASLEMNGQLQRGLLRVVPITEAVLYATIWPLAQALLMLEVSPPLEMDALWLAHVADRFKLTPAQSLILESVGRGLSVDQIAAARAIKVGTVRAHLHELLSKTGQVKQAGLARLASGR